jgi:hypothetical protein
MFWEIWGLRNRFYEKWIFSQSQTKTLTKTHIANRCQKYPNHRLLVHNLHTMEKKRKKGKKVFVGWKVRPHLRFDSRAGSQTTEHRPQTSKTTMDDDLDPPSDLHSPASQPKKKVFF